MQAIPTIVVTWQLCTVNCCIPGWKGPRASANIRRRMCGYCSQVTVWYRLVPPQTVHLRFDQKLKNQGAASTLHTFRPSEPRLQHARSRSTISFVYCRNTIVPFFHARSHSLSPGCRAQLSVNHTQPSKPLNNAKSCTATTSLHSPFHPGFSISWGRRFSQ